MIQPIMLVASILWVAIAGPPRYLWNYLLAQGVVTLCLFTTLQFYAFDSAAYVRVWALCHTLLAGIILGLGRYFVALHPARWLAIACAAFLAVCFVLVTHRGLEKPLAPYEWLAIAMGAILVGCGTVLGVSAPYHYGRDRMIALTLGMLFIAQSLWQVGFVLHDSPAWARANFVIPTMLCVAAWTWLGVRLWRYRKVIG